MRRIERWKEMRRMERWIGMVMEGKGRENIAKSCSFKNIKPNIRSFENKTQSKAL